MNYSWIISIGDPTSRESSRAAASTDRCFPSQGGPRLLGQHRQALRVQAQVSDREEAEDRDGRTSRKIFFNTNFAKCVTEIGYQVTSQYPRPPSKEYLSLVGILDSPDRALWLLPTAYEFHNSMPARLRSVGLPIISWFQVLVKVSYFTTYLAV